jgi:glycerate kinase
MNLIIKNTDHIIISLGGMDSFDGGVGMLQALGAKFYDDENRELDATIKTIHTT